MIDITKLVETPYPGYEILIGTGEYSPDNPNLYSDTSFFDFKVIDKMNQIPQCNVTFHSVKQADLESKMIRVYLDGEKIFSGFIPKAVQSYKSLDTVCEALGLAEEMHKRTITKQKDFKYKPTSSIINDCLLFDNWAYDIDSTPDYILNYRVEKGNYLMHINYLSVINFWEWWITEEDSPISRTIHVKAHRGNLTPSVTFTLETNAAEGSITKSKETVKNFISVTGASSQASNLSAISAGFFDMGDKDNPTEMGHVIGSESCLAELFNSTDWKMHLENVSGYYDSGKVQIDDEQIEYVAIAGDYLFLIRPPAGEELLTWAPTSAQLSGMPAHLSHQPGQPVLNISLLRAYVPPTIKNTVWIGEELIKCGSIDYWGLHDLQRGYPFKGEPTDAYAHGDGTKIFNGDYSPTEPSTNSSIALYSKIEQRAQAIGAMDRDALDKYASSILLSLFRNKDYGSFIVPLDQLKGLVVGDVFYLVEYGKTERVQHRCTGIEYGLQTAIINFGLNEEGILQQFDDIGKTTDVTFAKPDKAGTTSINMVSPDSKSVKVKINGVGQWVKVT